ncbi:MAG: hypothetical protein ACI9JZ_001506 [Lentimonas sp.]|jgi:hypothetical protein
MASPIRYGFSLFAQIRIEPLDHCMCRRASRFDRVAAFAFDEGGFLWLKGANEDLGRILS